MLEEILKFHRDYCEFSYIYITTKNVILEV